VEDADVIDILSSRIKDMPGFLRGEVTRVGSASHLAFPPPRRLRHKHALRAYGDLP
jgi:hypothetical protein